MLWGESLLALQQAAPAARFVVAGNDQMDAVRAVKDPEELRLMGRAAEITDLAMAATLAQMRIGMTERDVATEVLYQIKRHGGDGGPHSIRASSASAIRAIRSATSLTATPIWCWPRARPLPLISACSTGDIAPDFGRSVFMGEPRADALSAYSTCARIIRETAATMGDGRTTPAQMADVAMDVATADGFGDRYMYLGLGHSIGLEVHESPWIRPGSDEPICANMCFTLEPKIWQPGDFYVRCEDVVVVGPEEATSLTQFTYDPLIVE